MSVAGILSGRNILVVEDDFFVADELERNLNDAGAEVIGPFSRIDDAIETLRLRVGAISAAVLDVNIGGGTIYPLATKLREAGIPFIFATGYDARAIPDQFSAVQRLVKPVARQRLVGALENITR